MKSLAKVDFDSTLLAFSLSSVLTFVQYLLSIFALEGSIIWLANAFGLISCYTFPIVSEVDFLEQVPRFFAGMF